jgi:hypothetical protein
MNEVIINDNYKKCTRCKEIKQLDKFTKCINSKDGIYSQCKDCKSELAREYRKNNPEKAKELDKKRGSKYREKSKNIRKIYYEKNKDKFKDKAIFRKFGISLDDYNKMFEKQKGCCIICNKHQIEFDISLAIDHCHKTGKIRGLLCSYCNMGIGLLGENVKTLEKAIEYLKQNNG